MKKREKIWRGVLSDVTNMDVGPVVSVYTWQMFDGSVFFHAPTRTSPPVDLTLDGPSAEADDPAAESEACPPHLPPMPLLRALPRDLPVFLGLFWHLGSFLLCL